MTKKKKTSKEYASDDVKGVRWLRKTTNKSIRTIAKETGIPKSVVGRWVKEDRMYYVQKYDFRDVKRKVKTNIGKKCKIEFETGEKITFTKKDYEKFLKMEDKILNHPIGRQSELTIEYYDDDDGEGGYYSVTTG